MTSYFVCFFEGRVSNSAVRKLGITVTKGVGKAHERNRIKRQVREFFRLNKGDLSPGCYVFKARARAADADNKTLREDLKESAARIVKYSEGKK